MHLTSEFRLVAACCRWPPDPAADARIAAWTEPVDWRRLLGIVARHRVEGLVHHAFGRSGADVPETARKALREAAMGIARQNLVFAAEARGIAQILEAASIPYLFLKGLTLNQLAYGSIGLKRSVDIDVAVPPDRYAEAVERMQAEGYRCLLPGPECSPDQILRSVYVNKHSIWRRGRATVELHYHLVDSPLMLAGVSAASPRQAVEVAPGVTLPTLATEELFAYLCVHGATHAWSRLKWIADVNAFVASAGDAEVERLHARAVELGGGRSGGQALLLCADLFGRRLPERLEKQLRSDRATVWLARVAKKAMARGGGEAELETMVLGTAEIHLSHLRLMKGWRYKAAELRRKLAPGDPAARSSALSLAAGGPRWLLRRARTAWRRGAQAVPGPGK